LTPLLEAGVIEGFDSPAHYLPSVATQRLRLDSLPDEAELRARFATAAAELPLRAEAFEPFFANVEAARRQAPLRRADIEGTSLAAGVDAMLVRTEGRWTALMPLRAGAAAGQDAAAPIDAARMRAELAKTGLDGVYFVDMKSESDRLYSGYLREAIQLSLAGLLAIVALLFITTRSVGRVLRIVAPLAIAVAVVVAGLVLAGRQLTILHLVGMLLVVAVGSNYALFFDRASATGPISPRTLASLLLAATTTVCGFGLLAFSSVPVLNAIGTTVGPGAILALLFSAILARRT
jgi:predicted exporter